MSFAIAGIALPPLCHKLSGSRPGVATGLFEHPVAVSAGSVSRMYWQSCFKVRSTAMQVIDSKSFMRSGAGEGNRTLMSIPLCV